MIFDYNGKKPKIGKNVFIAPTATIIGDVTIKDNASIWYGTILRGDMAPIVVGENTNIQDNCTVHLDTGKPAIIGANVSIGHNAVIHGCTIEPGCLIGINAVVLSDATVKAGSVVAAGAVVREGQHIGPSELWVGTPAVKKKDLKEADLKLLEYPVKEYLELAQTHARITRA